MPEDNATESSVESVSTSLQNSKPDNTIASATDIVETLGASVSTVSQPSELSTPVDVTETMVASLSTVLQSKVSITNAEVEKLLETAPAMASKMIKLYICMYYIKIRENFAIFLSIQTLYIKKTVKTLMMKFFVSDLKT